MAHDNNDQIGDATNKAMGRYVQISEMCDAGLSTDHLFSFDEITLPGYINGHASFLENFPGSNITSGSSSLPFLSPLERESLNFPSAGGGLFSSAVSSLTEFVKVTKMDEIHSNKTNPCVLSHVTSHILPRHDAPAHQRHVPAEVIRHLEKSAILVTRSGTVSVSDESCNLAESGHQRRELLSENLRRIDSLNMEREQYEKVTPNQYKLKTLPAR